jgi:signal transduction histidine kinase
VIATLFAKYKSSIAIKLIFAFIMTVCIALLSLLSLLWYWEKRDFEQRYIPGSLGFAQVVISDLGTPPSIVRAAQLSVYFDSDIYISSNKTVWASNQQSLPKYLKGANFRSFAAQGFPAYSFYYSELHGFNIRWVGDEVTVYLTEDPGFLKLADLRPMLFMFAVMMLFILIFYYLLTRRFFSPVHQIEQSIRQYTAGDLSQRINLNSQDEFGQLANQLDLMRNQIQCMLESKRQLLLSISHELRTPLTRATISLAMLEESELTTDVKNDLKDINSLIEGLLEGERLGDAHQILNLSSIKVNQLLNEVVSLYPTLSIELKPLDVDVFIKIDITRIQLLLRSLINNADLYANSDTAIYLTAEIENDEIVLSVQDTGIGIAIEHLQRLTEPFYRVETSKPSNAGGYGLGLYLCQKIAQAHGGRLRITSEINNGVQIYVNLPMLTSN